MWKRLVIGVLGVVGLIVFTLVLALFFVDEPLRAYIESNLNHNLKGYSVDLQSVDFHPLGFSIDFHNLTLRQDANPEPPLLFIPSWSAGIQWTELLKMEIVSDHVIERADMVLLYSQTEQEKKDKTDLEERGWQDALLALYPVTINTFHVKDSTFSYRGPGKHPPLVLTNVQLTVENIQNIRSKDGEYPSTVRLESRLNPSGTLVFSGKANFLATPFPGVAGDIQLTNIAMKSFEPVVAPMDMHIHAGTLTGQGYVEYSPWNYLARIIRLEVQNPRLDFVQKAFKEKEDSTDRDLGLQDDANTVKPKEPFRLVVNTAVVKNGEFGYRNHTTEPPYNIFVNRIELQVNGIGFSEAVKESEVTLSGKFMGHGDLTFDGVFHPRLEQPDFDVKLKIEKTDMTTLNSVFKAYGGFDVKGGTFSLFSELNVHDGQVKGYIKPFFDKPEIFDLSQEKTDNIFQQLYEGLIGVVASVLENVPRDEVATKTEIKGNLKNIEVGTWELIGNLLKNAFFDAMTPAFENLKQFGRKT